MSQKLKLELDALQVESFTASPEPKERGTVGGRGITLSPDHPECLPTRPTEAPIMTCQLSYCIAASCDWTACVNMTCQGYCGDTGGTGGGGGTTTVPAETCGGGTCIPETA